ncbi:DUF6597 domain-containing transcriptional factor [Kordia sp.]|uniref:DUF6597 domain-containing transcriptional factor n=1 Tax=Kordia sp. TaxID=1965332 RepID=UPI003B59BB86
MYQEIKPSKRIDSVVDSFWTFSKNKSSENFKILPDNCTDIIFDLKQNKGFLSGVMSKYQLRRLSTESDLIGIRFKTENFGSLSKIPLDGTKNLKIELSSIFPKVNLDILSQINDLENLNTKIKFLENFIETLFKQNYTTQDPIVLSVVKSIRLSKGVLTINNLAKSHHISLRQLERRFKSYMGLTVKEFSNVVRFENAKKRIKSSAETSLLKIAFDSGFFDHSHMNYEFNRISGENPSYFR